MADTKLDDLTALTTPSGDDILYIVDDPAGTPLDRKIALNNLFTRGTITASAPVLDASQTWNNGAVTFTGLKLNATDTASAAASLLINLQVGGASRFSVSKTGILTTASAISASGNYIGVFSNAGEYLLGVSSDLRLGRRGAANLRLGSADAAAPVAQTLSVQSVVAGTTNTAGANLTITGSQGTGTGAGGSIIFQVAPAGSSGSAQNALSTALTIASTTDATFANAVNAGATSHIGFSSRSRLSSPADGVIRFSNNASADFDRLQFGGTTSSFPALKRSTTFLQARLADDSAFAGFAAANVQAATAYTVATLPTPATGMIARVTDANTPVIGMTVAGGGAAYALVNYNGANWTVIGV